MCGDLRATDAGKPVTLMGWVNRRRDHGDLIFLDLRDRSGITQVVRRQVTIRRRAPQGRGRPPGVRHGPPSAPSACAAKASPTPTSPPATSKSSRMNCCCSAMRKPRPSPRRKTPSPTRNFGLQYRYLDLRRPQMQQNFLIRHKVAQAIRAATSAAKAFLKSKPPMLTKSTPEGARDYLVPSRVHPGEFYALSRSPRKSSSSSS